MKKIAFWRLDNEGRLLSTYRISDIKGFFLTYIISLPFNLVVIFLAVKVSIYLAEFNFLLQYVSPTQMIVVLTLTASTIISIVITKPDAYSNTSIYFSMVIPALTYFTNHNLYTNYDQKLEIRDVKYISNTIYLMMLYKKQMIVLLVLMIVTTTVLIIK